MSKDSQFNFIHLKESHHVLYLSNWVHDKLPFDAIDNPHVLNFENDHDVSLSLPPATFGSIKSNKKKSESWKDLDTFKFIDDENGFNNQPNNDGLLKNIEIIDLNLDKSPEKEFDSSYLFNSSFSNSSSSSLPNIEITATPDTRSRSSQRKNFQTPANYQTPISRIMR